MQFKQMFVTDACVLFLWNAVVIPDLDNCRSPWRRFLLSFVGIYTSGSFGHDLVRNLARPSRPGRTIRV